MRATAFIFNFVWLLVMILTVALIGTVSQAQTTITLTADKAADETEQSVRIFNRLPSTPTLGIDGVIEPMFEANTNFTPAFAIVFDEPVTVTITNNNPDVILTGIGFPFVVTTEIVDMRVDSVSGYPVLFNLRIRPALNTIVEGTQPYSVVIAWRPTSSSSAVTGSTASVTLSGIVRDDDGGFTLAPDPFLGSTLDAIAEEETTTFTVVLDGQPTNNVVLTLTNTPEVTLGATALTFTNSNWNMAQTVSVTGGNNFQIGDMGSSYTITVGVNAAETDDAFDDLDDQMLSGMVTDNDIAGFTLTPVAGSTLTAIEEGSNTTTFTLALNAQPQNNNVIFDVSTTSTDITLSDSSVTIMPATWNTPVTVTVTSRIDNTNQDGNADYMVTVAVNADSDDDFDALDEQLLSGTVTDDETASFVLTPAAGSTLAAMAEGANTITFTLVLGVQPQADVVFDVSTTSSDITLSDSSVTFMPTTWDTPVTVTVTTRADNTDQDGNADYIITVAVNDAQSHDAFDALAEQLLSGTVIDDERASSTTEIVEMQSKVAIAVADTFGTAQLAADLISARIQTPLANEPQVSFAGRQLRGSSANISVLAPAAAKDPWDHEARNEDHKWRADFASLGPGTNFVLPLSSSDHTGTQFEFWGSVGYTDFQGDPTVDGTKIDYDGDATGVQVGLSSRANTGTSWGLSVGSTKVEIDLAGNNVTKIERDLLSLHPYIGWSIAEDTNAWLIAGIGDGDYDLELANGTQENTEASMLMLGGGLQRAWKVSNYDFAARLEGTNTRSEIEDTDTMDGGKGSAWQLRAELEVGRSFRTATGGQVHPYATFGYRHDGGDIGSFGAGEIGLGFQTTLSDAWTADFKSRFQITDADHEQHSYQGYVHYDRGLDQRGLLFSAGHSLETPADTTDTIAALSGRLGYGWGRTVFNNQGVISIHLQIDSSVDAGKPILGWQFVAPSLQLGIDGSSDEIQAYFNFVKTDL